jgi:hypothetical protein
MCLVFSCLLILPLTSCQFSTSPFAQATQNAGAIFAAARVTLNSVHTGKMTRAYATASFAGYLDALQGTRKRLLSAQNDPEQSERAHLLALYQAALPIIISPCLHAACNWQGQMATLKKAEEAFLEASSA